MLIALCCSGWKRSYLCMKEYYVYAVLLWHSMQCILFHSRLRFVVLCPMDILFFAHILTLKVKEDNDLSSNAFNESASIWWDQRASEQEQKSDIIFCLFVTTQRLIQQFQMFGLIVCIGYYSNVDWPHTAMHTSLLLNLSVWSVQFVNYLIKFTIKHLYHSEKI